MLDYGRIRSTRCPAPRVIDAYSVWRNTDVQTRTQADGSVEYEYNQVRYTKDEYIGLLDEKNTTLEQQVTDTQVALTEVYEMMI